jgi:hypothetical protein
MSFQDKLTQKLNEITTNETEKLQEWLLDILSSKRFIKSDEDPECYHSYYLTEKPILGRYVSIEELVYLINNLDPRIVGMIVYLDEKPLKWDSYPSWIESGENTKFKIYYSKDPNNKYLNALKEKSLLLYHLPL